MATYRAVYWFAGFMNVFCSVHRGSPIFLSSTRQIKIKKTDFRADPIDLLNSDSLCQNTPSTDSVLASWLSILSFSVRTHGAKTRLARLSACGLFLATKNFQFGLVVPRCHLPGPAHATWISGLFLEPTYKQTHLYTPVQTPKPFPAVYMKNKSFHIHHCIPDV